MKTLERILFVFVLALTGFMLTGVSGCSTLTKVENALTGSNAVLSCKIVGAIVDTTMTDAAKMYHDGTITAAQWNTLATLHDTKFLPVYNAEVQTIVAGQSPASSTLIATMSQIVATYQTFTPSK